MARCRVVLAPAAILAGLLLAPGSSQAFEPFFPTEPAVEPTVPVWRQAIYKTITNETMANIADVALFVAFFGATPAAAAGFFAVNIATHTTVYYGHELAWGYLGPDVTDENQLRIAVEKTASYRVVSAVRHYALGNFLGGGGAAVSLTYTVAAEVVDAAVYFTNETLWWMFGPPVIR
ncbi:MAG: hypothetical protein IT561_25310 [Alphaproteobacteria bacterium]|nr:hypothetical protein [Alphaproteobacteria bacterium]